ncbi:GAF and ANTAR domain-containing protein [Kutzneria sp. 744]|uniref:GAF and ANTAR domain-containing protein n=1 Tax=Kutzneria sp. (strain 744) TaxID=345341 RepID=UPI0003EEDA0A|nr:GAF and ANTAR domain-containing protein [Kutzneria sp. 744]EWM12140.1 ANTAR domain-containing protein [Kutzneria sp. 744]
MEVRPIDDDRLLETFVELADTLTDDFDVIDFMHLLVDRCVELLDVDAAGLLLADQNGRLRLIANSDEQVRLLELFQLQSDQGPCLDAFRTGTRVSHPDLAVAGGRWPRFAAAAVDGGFAAVDALPMRLRGEVIGALNLFRTNAGELTDKALRTATALADVATVGLLQERAIRNQEIVTEQLQTALNSRIVIEQAKGLIAERLGIDMGGAFAALRGYARSRNLKLSEVARAVVAGTTGTHDLLGTPALTNRSKM